MKRRTRYDIRPLPEEKQNEVIEYLVCDSEEGFSSCIGNNGEHFIFITENQWEGLIMELGIRLIITPNQV